MTAEIEERMTQLPEEMLRFVLDSASSISLGPRLGQLFSAGRPPIRTPHYVVSSSRGAIPHISHDVLQSSTQIQAVYLGLEDFIEKSADDPPVFKQPIRPGETRLRKFVALPSQCLAILGPRRVPAIPCHAQNTKDSIAVSTSVGFRRLSVKQYSQACHALKPDISCGIADIILSENVSKKRLEKSADRSHAWLRDAVSFRDTNGHSPPLFASVPHLEKEQMQLYLDDLADEYTQKLSGMTIYDPSTALHLNAPSISILPRIGLLNPSNPHAILRSIALGVDMISVPLVTAASEAGIGFEFSFPCPKTFKGGERLSLGTSLWSSSHAASTSPLKADCQCYTCTKHTPAYIHHLLQAKEMLAWTLLQIHNLAVLDSFFENVRLSIGQATFEIDAKNFDETYEPEFPVDESRGKGPRPRGYQLGRDTREKRERAWGRFEEKDESITADMGGGVQMAALEGIEDGAVFDESLATDELKRLRSGQGEN